MAVSNKLHLGWPLELGKKGKEKWMLRSQCVTSSVYQDGQEEQGLATVDVGFKAKMMVVIVQK